MVFAALISSQCRLKMDFFSNSSDHIPYFPEEVIFNILINLPADVLCRVMRFVCKKWYDIITSPSFVKRYLLFSRANPGLLIHQTQISNHTKPLPVEVFWKRDASIEKISVRFPTPILSSCDGLVLFFNRGLDKLFVANPVTTQVFALPSRSDHNSHYRFDSACLGRTPVSNKYKVMCNLVYMPWWHNAMSHERLYGIFTLGVDSSWRTVDGDRQISKYYDPKFAGNFFYWVTVDHKICVVDAETEVIRMYPLPHKLTQQDKVLAMGDHLSMVEAFGNMKWDVWKLRFDGWLENGDWWTKVCTIDLEGTVADSLGRVSPLMWHKNGRVLIFLNQMSARGIDLAYDVDRRECYEFESMECRYPCYYVEHFSSFVWWK